MPKVEFLCQGVKFFAKGGSFFPKGEKEEVFSKGGIPELFPEGEY